MVKVGDSIMFSGGEKDTVCEIAMISKDGRFFLIVDEKNVLFPDVQYTLSVTKREGLFVGRGILVKLRERVPAKGEKKDKRGALIEYVVGITRPFQKVQSRNAYRQDSNIPVELNAYQNKDFKNPVRHRAIVTNLSAGGARLMADTHLEKNTVVNLIAELGADRLDLLGAVIDSRKNEDAQGQYQYVIRVKFTRISEGDAERISKYIFEEFRKERRRQLREEQKRREENESK